MKLPRNGQLYCRGLGPHGAGGSHGGLTAHAPPRVGNTFIYCARPKNNDESGIDTHDRPLIRRPGHDIQLNTV